MSFRKQVEETLTGFGTGGSAQFSMASHDDALIIVTGKSVSLQVTVQVTPDGGTTWVTDTAGPAASTADEVIRLASPSGIDYRLVTSTGTADADIIKAKRAGVRG